ncbi:MAG: hypothetical protein ABSA79_05025 [Candidatus Bathyarchaeia archaeon]|jgi:hypothetical protein
MRFQQPLPHWNNFTVPELKQIMVHCRALERLGIAQDEEMMISIERDITMREKISAQPFEPKLAKTRETEKQKLPKINKKEQPQELLLEQTANN